MKKLVTVCLVLAIVNSTFAQKATDMKSAKSDNSVSEGKNIVNVYYGVSLVGSFYKSVIQQGSLDAKIHTIGPVGLVYEHLVTEKIGIGAEFGYASVFVSYNSTNSYYVGSQYVTDTYSYEYEFKTIRAMFRANFHFAKSEKFDAYGLISAGYKNSKVSFKTSDPYYLGGTSSVTFPIPFGIKPGIGFRYFFTNQVGLNLEIAIGTPVMCGGLSFKF